jgi:putative ABC transport system permease protein
VWEVTRKGLLAHKFRLLLTSISIVLGVGFVAGTFVFTDTISSVFDHLFTQTTSGTDAVVRAKLPFKVDTRGGGGQQDRAPVPDSLVPLVQSTPGVAAAQGSVNGYALVVGKDGKAIQGQAPTLGVSWGPIPRFAKSFNVERGSRPTLPNQVALDDTTAGKAKVDVGDTVRIVFLTVPPEEFKVSAVFKFGDAGNLAGATLAAFEPTTAQRVTNRVGVWDEIDTAAKSGVSQTQLRDNLTGTLQRAGLTGRYESITQSQLAKETANNIKQGLSFFNTFLLIFALVALFVGAFIIYNTFSIIVAQRAREVGLLKAIGASGRQVTGSVAIEALVTGVFSSVVGLVFGIGVAAGLKALLKTFGVDLPSGSIEIKARTIIVGLVLGVVVTVVSALAPARRAAKVPPVAAIQDHTTTPSSGLRRYIIGGVFTLIGVALLFIGLFGNVKSSDVPGGGGGLVGIAAFLVFVGVAMLSPLIAGPAARALGWPSMKVRGITGELARENAARNTRRTASTAAALMIGLALITFVSTFGASAKKSFADAIDRTNRADFQLAGKGFNGFTPQAANAVRQALPGGTVVEFRAGTWQYNGEGKDLVGTTPDLGDVVDVKLQPGADLDGFAQSGVLVYKDAAKSNNLKVGQTLPMRFSATGVKLIPIRGIFDDNQGLGIFFSSYILSLKDYEANFTTQLNQAAGVRKPPNMSAADARVAIDKAVAPFPNVDVQDNAQAKEAQLSQFNTIINLMGALLLLAIIIALIGIVNTLALSIYERTRELGLLRAVGMTRAQMKRMVRSEAVIIAVFGTLMGVVIGVLFGRAIVASLSNEGIAFSVPVAQIVVFIILSALAGLFAGTFPARRAANLDILRAIATE